MLVFIEPLGESLDGVLAISSDFHGEYEGREPGRLSKLAVRTSR